MKLGEVLKAARLKKGKSLRDVEREVEREGGGKISNGQLSLLESDEIKQPSPFHLHTLATYYGLDYGQLMIAAGYFMPPSASGAEAMRGIALSAEKLGAEDRELMEKVVEHLRSGDGELVKRSLDIVEQFRPLPHGK